MTNLIDRHLDEVAALCRLAGARKLDAFGSVVRADFDPQTSDLDFLVEFDDVPPAAYEADEWFDWEAMAALKAVAERKLGELERAGARFATAERHE